MPLFDNVFYHISQSLPEETRTEIGRILDHNGAIAVELKGVTHIISNTIEFEGCDTLPQNVPYWVERSMELGILQDSKFFSADKSLFFSGVIAACADLPEGDREVIASVIQELGGAWREGLTKDVTHLIVTNANSEKYRVAMHFRDSAQINVVLPHWFDQCWAMQTLIPTTLFQFPDPPYLKREHDINWYKSQLANTKDGDHLSDGFDKKAMLYTLTREPSFRQRSPLDIWQGRKILFSASLELNDERKEALEERVRSAGGSVLSASTETEGTVVDDADVLITRYRSGAAYTRALSKGKTIGSLAWFLYVDKIGIISRPRDQLLHYPIRSKPIPGFEHHEITVTNYQGDARNYLKKLIQLMGATFTPTMSGKNTVVIAAYKSGSKTTKAEEWSVPVVNHKWLEDCFVEWRNLTPASKKYIDFAQGFNYGERGVGHVGLQTDPELPAEPDKEASTSTAPVSVQTSKPSPKKARPKARPQQPDLDLVRTNLDNPVGTGNSFRDALEVEEVEDVLSALDNPVPSVVPIDDDRPPLSGSVTSPAKDKPKPRPKPKSATLVKEQNSVKYDVKLPEKKYFVPDEEGKEPELEGGRVDEEEEEEEEVPVRTKKKQRTSIDETTQSNPKTKLKSTAKTVRKSKSESNVSVEEIPLPSKKIGLSNNTRGFSTGSSKMSKSNNKKVIDDETSSSHDEEDDNPKAIRTPPPAKPKSKSRSPSKSTPAKRSLPPPSSDASDHEIVEIKRPKVVHTYKSPAKAKAGRTRAASSSGDEEHSDVIEVTKVMSGHKATAQKAIRPKPTRTVAVELPDNWSVTKSIPGRSPAKPSTSAQNDVDPGIQSSSENSSIFFVSRPPPQRSAAAAASEKLRNKVIPDVINFENERKRNAASTRRRKSSLGTSLSVDDDEGSDASVRVVKKARFSMDAGESDDTPKGFVTHAKGFKKSPSVEKKARIAKSDSEATKRSDGASSIDPRKIRILTTKIEVPDDVEQVQFTLKAIFLYRDLVHMFQVLTKIGVKFTTKPTECTHLVASGMARTEKFLCALPQAPFVLNGDWLAACAKEKKILDFYGCPLLAEEQFLLQDPDVEHKHKFKLLEALQRARELKKKKTKLLQGHTFYITPNVKVDYEMLNNILKANGAQSKQATPNARNLSDTKHVISCLKDEHLWRTLDRSGIPIYSQELVLSGAFKQSMDWKSPEMRVQSESA
ncbi:hypothetical protein Clacol_003219 [Clathrus columnatus]|uniref:BRCT domain-containing protein n=1 Tax=Clathrus columnatus TaxID=1419009 RepID=A0AAV5A8M4_9AGAM|nr:hypothetical protein Clacol_003219 [Clathrus columnatus]